jgi:hypothetical protein
MSNVNMFVPPLGFLARTAVQVLLSHDTYCQIVKVTLCINVVTGQWKYAGHVLQGHDICE